MKELINKEEVTKEYVGIDADVLVLHLQVVEWRHVGERSPSEVSNGIVAQVPVQIYKMKRF